MQGSLFSRIQSLWSIQEEFRLKVFLLATTYFLMMGCQAIWRPLKVSIFAKIVGAAYTPDAKLYTLLALIPFIILYSWLVDVLRRHQLLYFFNLFHGIGGLIFAFILANPTYGIANVAQSPHRITGWLFYLFMESFSAFLAASFWSFANSINKPKDAKNFYGIYVAGSKCGGMLAAGALYFTVTQTSYSDTTLLPAYLLVGSILLFAAAGCVYLLMKKVPGYYMHGYEAVYKIEKKRVEPKKSLFEMLTSSLEGLFIIISNSYVFGVFSLVLFYDIMSAIFDYRVLLLADAANPTAGGLTAYYALYYFCMHFIGLLISLFGTTPLQRVLGIRTSLFVFPLLSAGLIIASFVYPSAEPLFIILVLLRALNYALNYPTREVLYIPTTKAIKFKAKAWTDAFGSRIAKAVGSIFNKAANGMTPAASLTASTSVNLSLSCIWLVVVYFLGRRLTYAITHEEVIGTEHEKEEYSSHKKEDIKEEI